MPMIFGNEKFAISTNPICLFLGIPALNEKIIKKKTKKIYHYDNSFYFGVLPLFWGRFTPLFMILLNIKLHHSPSKSKQKQKLKNKNKSIKSTNPTYPELSELF